MRLSKPKRLLWMAGIVLSITYVSSKETDPSDNYPFYRTQFLLVILLAMVGAALNSTLLGLFLTIPKTQRKKEHIINVAIVTVDLLYMLNLLGGYSVSYTKGTYLGTLSHSMCLYETFVNFTLTITAITLLASISHVIKMTPVCERVDVRRNIVMLTIASGLYAGIGTLIAVVTAGGVEPVSSGSFCYFRSSIATTLVTMVIAGLPITWMCYNIVRIYLSIRQSLIIIAAEGKTIEGSVEYPYIKKMRNVIYFSGGLVVCVLPVFGFFLYSRLEKVSKRIEFAAGFLTSCYPAIINPLIFFSTNNSNVNDHLKEIVSRCYQNCFSVYGKSLENRIACVTEEDIEYLNNLESWLCDDRLLGIFRDYCKSVHAAENIMFYEDVIKYRRVGEQFLNEFDASDNIADILLIEKWDELSCLAKRMYTLYIKVSI